MSPVSQLLLAAFEGREPPQEVLDRVSSQPPAGFSIFALDNVDDVDQMCAWVAALEAANTSELPLLIAADQEGGQLIALRGTTNFPGNMALGAANDTELTQRVAYATAQEMLAMGVNLNYAPVADIMTNPANPSLGIRSFGDVADEVAKHVAATVQGLRAGGVLSVLKHFPGKGGAAVDSHYKMPLVSGESLGDVELVPFVAGLAAGAELVMTGHFAVSGLTESDDVPATLSHAVLTDLLRTELGFDGAVITDAFDMGAISQGDGQVIDAIAAVRAGADLILLKGEGQQRLEDGLTQAVGRGIISGERISQAVGRVRRLRESVSRQRQPPRSLIGSQAHIDLAREAAASAITLVRDEGGLLPIRLESHQRIAVVMPLPIDLTPADTSSRVAPGLGPAVIRHHANTEQFVVDRPIQQEEIDDLVSQTAEFDLIVLGTISASLDPQQAVLAKALLATETPVVTIALRTPYDLTAYPSATTYLCSYGLLPPSLEATADALFGAAPITGHLPVSIPSLYEVGHGLERKRIS